MFFRLDQARKWLSNPGQDDKGLGRRAINAIIEEGRKVSLNPHDLFSIFKAYLFFFIIFF